jgi:hypothetical protein
MQAQPARRSNRTTLNLLVDIGIFVAFLVIMAPHFSGVAVHEWLSFAFGAAIITHLLLHSRWIVEVTRRLLRGASASARVNYVLNALLFVAMTVAMLSGVLISEVALPTLGITLAQSRVWRELHELSANSSLLLIGLHVALHWSWIVGAVKRLAGRARPLREQAVAATPRAKQEELPA